MAQTPPGAAQVVGVPLWQVPPAPVQSPLLAHWYLQPATVLAAHFEDLQYPLQQLLVVVPLQLPPTAVQEAPWHCPVV